MLTKILLAGGYGSAGFQIAKLLCKYQLDIKLTICGRNLEKARLAAERLIELKPDFSIDHIQLDLASTERLDAVLPGYDLLLLATSTIKHVTTIANACLKANTDYYDIQISSIHKLKALQQLKEKIIEKDRCFITDGGFHPGMLSTMVRYAGDKLDQINSAHIYVALKVDWTGMDVTPSTKREFVDELLDYSNQIFQEGQWKKMSLWKTWSYDFGSEIGQQQCVPMYFPEMHELPAMFPTLKNTGVFITGFNKITDTLVLPFLLVALKVLPKSTHNYLSNLFWWSLKFCKPPFVTKLIVDASGIKDDRQADYTFSLMEADSYKLTAVPTVATILQYLDRSFRKSGLHFQANFVDSKRFFSEMERMGIITEEKIN
jgi:saccharopine dehydrogenase (NAD+, L-lysine-forming)